MTPSPLLAAAALDVEAEAEAFGLEAALDG
jgi:hypothetical protein